MDERHAVGETEADSAGAGLLGEERADVHARACESQITVPRAEHLARAAGEVEYPCPGDDVECLSEGGEFVGGQRVVDAVAALTDREDP